MEISLGVLFSFLSALCLAVPLFWIFYRYKTGQTLSLVEPVWILVLFILLGINLKIFYIQFIRPDDTVAILYQHSDRIFLNNGLEVLLPGLLGLLLGITFFIIGQATNKKSLPLPATFKYYSFEKRKLDIAVFVLAAVSIFCFVLFAGNELFFSDSVNSIGKRFNDIEGGSVNRIFTAKYYLYKFSTISRYAFYALLAYIIINTKSSKREILILYLIFVINISISAYFGNRAHTLVTLFDIGAVLLLNISRRNMKFLAIFAILSFGVILSTTLIRQTALALNEAYIKSEKEKTASAESIRMAAEAMLKKKSVAEKKNTAPDSAESIKMAAEAKLKKNPVAEKKNTVPDVDSKLKSTKSRPATSKKVVKNRNVTTPPKPVVPKSIVPVVPKPVVPVVPKPVVPVVPKPVVPVVPKPLVLNSDQINKLALYDRCRKRVEIWSNYIVGKGKQRAYWGTRAYEMAPKGTGQQSLPVEILNSYYPLQQNRDICSGNIDVINNPDAAIPYSPIIFKLIGSAERFFQGRYFTDVIKTAHIIRNVPSKMGYLNGQSLIGWLFTPIPTSLWPDKPLFIQVPPILANVIFGELYNNVPPGIIAELYLNFGWLGIIVGMFAVGYLLRFMFNTVKTNPNIVIIQFVYAMVMVRFTVILFNTSLGTAMLKSIIDIVPLIIVFWFVRKREASPDEATISR